jgi:hypothetical protein
MHPIKSKSMEERLLVPASSLRSVSIPHLIASCCCLSVVVVATGAVRLSGRRHRRPCLVAAVLAYWIACKRETMWRRRKLSAGWILVGRAEASRRYRGRFSEIRWNWPAWYLGGQGISIPHPAITEQNFKLNLIHANEIGLSLLFI